ncbi:SdpI family protein [Fluviispira vulneris]|uniref:SdpI family protein n=1 Tax=Fluviispira vulneris TaxID=2763012 RepID=UPI001647E63E
MKFEIFIDNILQFFSYIIICFIIYAIRNSEPNGLYGYRTRVSLNSRKNWKILNLYFCKYALYMMHIFNVLNIGSAMLKLFLYKRSEDKNIVLFLNVLSSIEILIGFLLVIIYMKKIERRLIKKYKFNKVNG